MGKEAGEGGKDQKVGGVCVCVCSALSDGPGAASLLGVGQGEIMGGQLYRSLGIWMGEEAVG